MIYTLKFSRAVFSATMALILLLSIDSPAAYRAKKVTATSLHSLQAEELHTAIDGNKPSPAKHSYFKQHRRIADRDEKEHHKLTSAETALTFGTIAALFALLGLSILRSVGGSISSLSALIGVGMFGVCMPLGFGAIAILCGIKGIRAKKQKTLAIIGLILGVLAVASAIAIAI